MMLRSVNPLKKVLKGLGIFFLTFCVVVTSVIGVITIAYPRQVLDFVSVAYLVKRDFLEKVNMGTLLDGATVGIAESTGDIRTYYLTPEENLEVSMSNKGITGVVGITVDSVKVQEDRLIIREVTPGGGAAAAGLRAGDAVLKIDEYLVKDLTVDQAVELVRGPLGTTVDLLIEREGEEAKVYSVARQGTTTVESVTSGILKEEYLPGHKIGYIAIDYFARNTDGLFDQALDAITEAEAEALIIDLRYNGGGDVEATRQIARRLMPDGLLLRLVTRDAVQEFRIENAEPIGIPYVLLVNGGSASASEILSGAVKDYGTGLLVGTQTYGKGSVQVVYDLVTGSGLRVTEGKYYLPGGVCIDGEGITPDYVVAGDPTGETDPQLDKALELIGEMVTGRETLAGLLERAKAEGGAAGAGDAAGAGAGDAADDASGAGDGAAEGGEAGSAVR